MTKQEPTATMIAYVLQLDDLTTMITNGGYFARDYWKLRKQLLATEDRLRNFGVVPSMVIKVMDYIDTHLNQDIPELTDDSTEEEKRAVFKEIFGNEDYMEVLE